ncbi:MAG: ABC transporter [Bacteroidetes bacterium HGW-Bacteroidetes-21]|jgi:ABC-type multidrug transport system ATPase subunit|nr:MAG: ABC transporter [Bacteroidetes bacterium HGW-Bacteroidetes-21]
MLNGLPINDKRIYLFASGSIVKPPKGKPGLYTDVVQQFLQDSSVNRISFEVDNLSFSFPNGHVGLRNINLYEQSGKLVGIMGSSGAGKTTLLNVLCGLEKPSQGEVLINDINLHNDSSKLKGIIGYVPQDDLLIEELTVYENLYYNAKLVFKEHTQAQINKCVVGVLNSLGLNHIRNLKVGSPLNKKISGGQRKRLNIGLELIREPAVLFMDEPTSGLSSRDSENVMELLSELTVRGKLIFTVIHQPSSNIFKMFDSIIIIDVGGYPVYYGNPVESVMYFKRHDNQINSDIGECSFCGNVNPESIFNILEAKILDDYGRYTDTRKVTSEEWNIQYENYRSNKSFDNTKYADLPETHKMPTWFQQLRTYFIRDFFSKLANKQYLIISLLEAPLIGFLLAFILRYINDPTSDIYVFRDNDNIMPYMFMCTIVAAFLGLMVSAEEIFKDRKILKRERFLNLSRSSYLFSKIGILFLLSAIQSLLFVFLGNYILEIKGMYFEYWCVFFSMAAFSNILGLNISSAFDSAVTIYILIPFLIIPQMVLSGAMFSFDKINKIFGGGMENVPILAEFMPSRWAFEALVVNQFVNNKYEQIFYNYEKQESSINYHNVYLLPEVKGIIDTYRSEKTISNDDLELLYNELSVEVSLVPSVPFQSVELIKPESFTLEVADSATDYIERLQEYFKDQFIIVNEEKDRILTEMQSTEEKTAQYQQFYDAYYNKHLAAFTKNTYLSNQLVRIGNHFVQKIDPIYLDPQHPSFLNFRTHFLAPQKSIFGYNISTFWFNILILWFFAIMMYFTLYFELIKRVFTFSTFVKMRLSNYFSKKKDKISKIDN